MVKECSYCGRVIRGDVIAGGVEGDVVYGDEYGEVVLGVEREIAFCSEKCVWRYGIKCHKDWGMTGKVARRHLIEEHGLTPPSKW